VSVSCVNIMFYCLCYLFSFNCLRPNKFMMKNRVMDSNELMIMSSWTNRLKAYDIIYIYYIYYFTAFIFSHFSYCHLNFNSYFWRYGPLVSSPKYEFSIYIRSFLFLSFKF
jgi:hypothetical protein